MRTARIAHRNTLRLTPFGERSKACARFRFAMLAMCVLPLLVGCAAPRYLANRSIRENPLASTLNLLSPRGPEISKRTWDTLRRYGQEDHYRVNHQQCFAEIRETINETPDPELIHALAELSYVEARKAEREGQAPAALNHYGRALTNAYDYLFSED